MQGHGAIIEARPVSQLQVSERATFIARTYIHLLAAILIFTLLEVTLFATGLAYPIANAMLGTSWLLVLGGFVVVSWIATRAAHQAQSLAVQYMALGGFILAEALIFVPLLALAFQQFPGAIQSAAMATLVGFGGLTGIVFYTRKDFSFLGALLKWGGVVALLLIVCAVFFGGFHLGTWFSVGMVAFAGAAVLYDTSNILHHYPADRYVGASLQLFASIAMMFWYLLRIFMSRR